MITFILAVILQGERCSEEESCASNFDRLACEYKTSASKYYDFLTEGFP